MTAANRPGVTAFATPSDREVVITRIVAAPRGLVFDCHTKPEHVSRWLFGPEGWSMPVCEIDLRPGGRWRFVYRKADGSEYETHGVYREIAAPVRIVNTEQWAGQWPETLNTTDFTEAGGHTTITLTMLFPSREARDAALGTGMRSGAGQSYERLDDYLHSLDGTHNVELARVFDAPVERVWRAWSDPQDVMRWWGPAGFTCPTADMDFREGGVSLVAMRAPAEFGGMQMYNTWTYRHIEPHRRIELDLRFTDAERNPAPRPEGVPAAVAHLITFTPVGETKTELAVTEFGYATSESRDLSQAGLEQCLDKMAAIFTEI